MLLRQPVFPRLFAVDLLKAGDQYAKPFPLAGEADLGRTDSGEIEFVRRYGREEILGCTESAG